MRHDGRPQGYLGCIAQEHAHDGGAAGCFVGGEERFARHPAVGHGFVVGFALSLAHDDAEAVVAQVAGLAGALYAVAQHGDDFVFQHFAGALQGELLACGHLFKGAAKIDLCHFLSFVVARRPTAAVRG